MAAIRSESLSRLAIPAQLHPIFQSLRIPRIVRRTEASVPAALDRQPALSAAQPDLAVLGRQHRAGALCRRPCAADDVVLRTLDRRLHPALAVREGSSAPR